MNENGDSTVLEVPIWVENDLETDGSGSVYVVSYVAVGGSEDPVEIRVPLEDIIDGMVEFAEVTSVQGLYTIAHELARYADQLRTTADRLEGLWPEEDAYDDLDEDESVDR
jgi:hypothetical protein